MGHLFEIPLSASLNPKIEFFPGCVLAIFKAKYGAIINSITMRIYIYLNTVNCSLIDLLLLNNNQIENLIFSLLDYDWRVTVQSNHSVIFNNLSRPSHTLRFYNP